MKQIELRKRIITSLTYVIDYVLEIEKKEHLKRVSDMVDELTDFVLKSKWTQKTDSHMDYTRLEPEKSYV